MLLPIGYLGGLRRIDEIWASTPPAHVVVIGSRMVVHGRPSQFNHVWVAWEPETTETRLHWAAVERTHSRDMSVYK